MIDDASTKYEPLLRTGTRLFVIDGPVAGSGYAWYQVLPISQEEGYEGYPTGRSGWVAVASRDGEPWMRNMKLDCPVDLFENFAHLLKLGPAAGLSCYGSMELSFLATVLESGCSAGGPSAQPYWLIGLDNTAYRFAAPWLEPAQVRSSQGGCFPDVDLMRPAFHPDSFGIGDPTLISGDVYQVWGHYDDLAAATCMWTDPEPGLDRVALLASCRMTLVVTQVEPFAGIDQG